MRISPRRASRSSLTLGLVAALAATGLMSASPSSAAATNNGSSELTAAASCWEIKQDNPSATDGVYWLQTPQLRAAGRFYCDMTTSGGGWVLVGRGRDGWSYDYNGKGSIDSVSSTVTGQAAFSPRQLDSHVVDGLLGGRRVDSMTDGVRLRRASNVAGTSWQESKFTFKSRDRWNWSFGAGHPIASFTVGGSSGSNTSTRDFGTDSSYKRVLTYEYSNNNWIRGFNYGSGGKGNTDPASYIYSTVAQGTYGTPFTQVYLRPKLRTSDLTYAAIPDSGTTAITNPSVVKSGALSTDWGVTGTGAGGISEDGTEAQAFAQIGNTMYVGGNFTTVQKGAGATGSDKVDQGYLAAFNATTGDWISGFRPTFDHQVKSLVALPNGKLAVGGEFSNVNGSSHTGIVVLEPDTGATDTSFTAVLENRITGIKVSVRALDTDGTYLYMGGAFTHIVRGSTEAFTRNAGRIILSTGLGDASWNPNFNGSVSALDVSDDKTRLYLGGYFTDSNGTSTPDNAAIRTTAGAAVIPWTPVHSTAGVRKYQWAVKQVGDRVWSGGSQHNTFSYSTSNFALLSSSITKTGGDIQAMSAGNGYVYAGCHCGDWNYQGTTDYDSLSPGQSTVKWDQADRINFVGAWDASTGKFVPDFTTTSKARNGMGAFALLSATDGTLWAGGSFTSAVKENGANQWVGGFVRYGMRDHTAPNTPRDGSVSLSGGTATVNWTQPTGGADSYEVIRGNRVVGTTTSTSLTVAGSVAGDRFFIRALDSAGNRSDSTPVLTSAATPNVVPFVTAGSTWNHWVDNSQAVDAGWKTPGFAPAGWGSGTAPLGWGSDPSIVTNVDPAPPATRPLASYFRRTFQVANPNGFSELHLTTRADDGIVVYVNGTEVARANMPAGTPTSGTYATAAPSTSGAVASPVSVTVPSSVLVAGTNAVAVEVHSNYRSTPSMSMDLDFNGTTGTPPPPPPPDPDPDPVPAATTFVADDTSWAYYVDNTQTVDPEWTSAAYDSGSWSTGPATLGWGSGVVTNIDVAPGQTRPLASYFRKKFTVPDPGAFTTMTLTTRADDGIVVYVNGTEVGRKNLPSGTISPGTYATAAPSTSSAEADPFVVSVPVALLTAGENIVTAEVHSNYRSTPSLSFALKLEAE